MESGIARFGERKARRVFSGLSPYAIGLSLVCLFWGLLPDSESYANVEYGFSLLAALGAVGCLGHLVAYAYRGTEYLSSAYSVLEGIGSLEVRRPDSVLVESGDWPLLVALLLGPFVLLLSGLGGWV